MGVWPQWQGQQSHHRSSSNEQHVQQPSAQQPGQPEVFQVRGSKDFRRPETGRKESGRRDREESMHGLRLVSGRREESGHVKTDVIN